MRLSKKLPNVKTVNILKRKNFTHFDFLYASDALDICYREVLRILKDWSFWFSIKYATSTTTQLIAFFFSKALGCGFETDVYFSALWPILYKAWFDDRIIQCYLVSNGIFLLWNIRCDLEENLINGLAVQKVLSGSGRAWGLRLMGKYIGHRLVARPEPDSTFRTDSTTQRTCWDTRFILNHSASPIFDGFTNFYKRAN